MVVWDGSNGEGDKGLAKGKMMKVGGNQLCEMGHTRMVKNLTPRVIHGQHLSPSGSSYPKEALRVGTLRRFLAGLLQSAVAQLSADPKIGTSFDFLDE
jgi:hypothetical protein